MSNLKSIADNLISELKLLNIEAYIWHTATTGSVYIRFQDSRMCSVRIGNHEGRGKLKYKYNLRSDIPKNHRTWVKDGSVWRCYIRTHNWKDLIPVLVDRHKQIQSWPQPEKGYFIPSFKANK